MIWPLLYGKYFFNLKIEQQRVVHNFDGRGGGNNGILQWKIQNWATKSATRYFLLSVFTYQNIVYQGYSTLRQENKQKRTILTAQAILTLICSTISRYDVHVCSSNVAVNTTMTIDIATTIVTTSGKRGNWKHFCFCHGTFQEIALQSTRVV